LTLVSTKKDVKKIFLTTKTKINHSIDSKIDVIVSPEFYWVRIFDIPVKTEAQARHVLPTLFEDIVNEKVSLTYQVKKLKENQFLCFAFNNKKIYDALKSSGLNLSNIVNLYFAQNECEEFNSFKIDDCSFLYTTDKILVKVPDNIAQDSIDLSRVLNNIKLTSMKMQIKLYNDVLTGKWHYPLYIIFSILIIVNFIRYFDYSSEIKSLENEVEKIKKVKQLPTSMIQMNSILSKYEKNVRFEKRNRDAISFILSNDKLNLKSLSLDKDELILEYLSVNKNEVENFLKKEFKNVKILSESLVLRVGVKL
jgi:hypothetical protein